MKFIKLYSSSLLTILLILMGWNTFYAMHCMALIFPAIVLFLISQAYIEFKMQERMCIKKCFFNENSIWAALLSSRIFVSLSYFVFSILMTISLMYGVIEYAQKFWHYLVIHIALVILLYLFLNNLFRQTLKENYHLIFVREWTSNISSLLLLSSSIYLEFKYGYIPDYLTENLATTIVNASNTYQSNCHISNLIIKIKMEIGSVLWWIISENSDYFANTIIKSVIWFGFLFFNSLALIAMSQFIVQIIYLFDRLFNLTQKKKNNGK